MYPAKYGYHVDEHIFVLSGNILPDRMVWGDPIFKRARESGLRSHLLFMEIGQTF